jgi:hypothetical protein
MKYLPFLYGAYGSNLNMKQMSRRCPDARPLGVHTIKDHRLVFRGVADIEESIGDGALVGLWAITDRCLDMLDIYEGFPHLYQRVFIGDAMPDDPRGEICEPMNLMVYKMVNNQTITAPVNRYLQCIVDGFNDFGMPTDAIQDALGHCYTNTTMQSTRSKIQII